MSCDPFSKIGLPIDRPLVFCALHDAFTKLMFEVPRSNDGMRKQLSFENCPISFPVEQDLGPFHWIITGSTGIGSWVGKRHLEKLVFDFPLFDEAKCFQFATHLSTSLDIHLEDTIKSD